MKHVLEADSVQLEHNGRKLLSDVYVKCETGTITALLGRNGQGKSSFFKAIFGTLDTEKSVRFDQRIHRHAFRQPRLIRYLPQFHFLPEFLTLQKVLTDYNLEHAVFEHNSPQFKNRFNTRVADFSGGERRWIELYLIVKCESQFALLDEPFTHLSPLQIEEATALINDEKGNKGFLISDHLHEHVTKIADTLYLLTDGKTHLIKNVDEIESLGYLRPSAGFDKSDSIAE